MSRLTLKRTINAVLLTLCSVLLLFIALIFTHSGNKSLIWAVNKAVNGLHLELLEGRLLGDARLNMQWQQDDLAITLNQLTWQYHLLGCEGICIDRFVIDDVKIENNATFEKETAPSPIPELIQLDLSEFTLPESVKVALMHFEVKRFAYFQSGTRVSTEQLLLAMKYANQHLVIETLTAKNTALGFVSTPEPNEKVSDEPLNLPKLPRLEVDLPLIIDVEKIRFDKLSVDSNGDVIKFDYLQLAAQFAEQTFTINEFDVMTPDARIQHQGWIQLHGLNSLEQHITVSHNNNHLTLNAVGDLSHLEVKANTQGQYEALLDGEVALRETNYPAKLVLTSQHVSAPLSGHQLAFANSKLHFQGHLDDFALSLKSEVAFEHYPETQLTTTLRGNRSKINIEQTQLTTPQSYLALDGHIVIAPNLGVALNVVAPNIELGEFIDELNAPLNGKASLQFEQAQDKWQVLVNQLSIEGDIEQIPVSVEAQLDLNDQLHSDVTQLVLRSGKNQVTLAGNINENWNLNGKVKLNDSAALLPNLQAFGTGDVVVSGLLATPKVAWNMDFSAVDVAGFKAAKISSSGEVDSAKNYLSKVVFDSESVTLNNKDIKNLSLNFSGDTHQHQGQFQLDSDWLSNEIELAGVYQNEQWQGTFSKFILGFEQLRLAPKETFDVHFLVKQNALKVSDHCWQGKNTEFCLKDIYHQPHQGHGEVQITSLNLAVINSFLPPEIDTSGDMSGLFKAHWDDMGLQNLTLQLETDTLAFDVTGEEKQFNLPIETLSISGQSDAKDATLALLLHSSLLGDINANIGLSDLKQARSLSGNVTLQQVELTDLQGFVSQIDKLDGTVSADITLAGNLQKPTLKGQLDATGIGIAGNGIPISLKDSHLKASFDQNNASLNATLVDEIEGTLALNGEFSWPNNQLAANVTLQGERFHLMPQPTITVEISPDLKANFSQDLLSLSGEVTVDDGRIRINELPTGAVSVSSDEIIIDKTEVETAAVPFNYVMDVTVNVNEKVQIDTFGLKSKISGSLNIKQDVAAPLLVTGDVNLLDGSYRSFGQELQIKTGQVGFSGPIDKPYLNVRAIRDPDLTEDGVIAGVHLHGNVSAPTLDIFSEPAMDQGVALSYVLSGKAPGEGDSSTDGMLTQLLLAQGLARGAGTVSRIGEAFGFSDISLSSRGSGDETKVEITGYVAPGIQVRYSIGIFDSLSEIAVRYQLMPQLYIEATNGVNDALDILYKFDWD